MEIPTLGQAATALAKGAALGLAVVIPIGFGYFHGIRDGRLLGLLEARHGRDWTDEFRTKDESGFAALKLRNLRLKLIALRLKLGNAFLKTVIRIAERLVFRCRQLERPFHQPVDDAPLRQTNGDESANDAKS